MDADYQSHVANLPAATTDQRLSAALNSGKCSKSSGARSPVSAQRAFLRSFLPTLVPSFSAAPPCSRAVSNAASMPDDEDQLPTGSYAIGLAHLYLAGRVLLFNLSPASVQLPSRHSHTPPREHLQDFSCWISLVITTTYNWGAVCPLPPKKGVL